MSAKLNFNRDLFLKLYHGAENFKGLSPNAVARMCKMPSSTLNEVLKGVSTNPSKETLAPLLKHLGDRAGDIWGPVGAREDGDTVARAVNAILGHLEKRQSVNFVTHGRKESGQVVREVVNRLGAKGAWVDMERAGLWNDSNGLAIGVVEALGGQGPSLKGWFHDMENVCGSASGPPVLVIDHFQRFSEKWRNELQAFLSLRHCVRQDNVLFVVQSHDPINDLEAFKVGTSGIDIEQVRLPRPSGTAP